MKTGLYYAKKYKDSYMESAQMFAKNSIASRLQVGCVIVLNDGMLAHGWNGMPSGSESEACEDTQNKTHPEVIHAEHNAILKIRQSMEVFYTQESAAFVTHAPCKGCASKLVEFGVSEVYYSDDYKSLDGINYLKDSGVKVTKM